MIYGWNWSICCSQVPISDIMTYAFKINFILFYDFLILDIRTYAFRINFILFYDFLILDIRNYAFRINSILFYNLSFHRSILAMNWMEIEAKSEIYIRMKYVPTVPCVGRNPHLVDGIHYSS